MQVLVTGGTGVVGTAAVRALLERGHRVRLLSRHAARDSRRWPADVETWPGDVSIESSIAGSADGCDAVVHLVGIIEETPPDITFERVNVAGTRHVVDEAVRAGVSRLVYVSSLGSAEGNSPYHESKRRAEEAVRTFGGEWIIVRPGAVYGPGDDHISVMLQMVRTLPVIPRVGDGGHRFQPIFHEDLARALALCVERADLAGRVLEVGGRELTTQKDLAARMRELTGRQVVEVPIPEMIAKLGVRALGAAGLDAPVAESQLEMLTEGNVVNGENALITVFGIEPTPLRDGLRRLLDEQPAVLPSEGVGRLRRKRYWADIRGASSDADGLFDLVCARLAELMPPTVALQLPGDSDASIREGETLTLEVPIRGHIQVRVAEVMDRRLTMLTLAGHPLAGAVRLMVEARGADVRFEVQVYERASGTVDLLLMRTVGEVLQRATWTGLIENVVEASGGESDGVRTSEEVLSDSESRIVEEWAYELNTQLAARA